MAGGGARKMTANKRYSTAEVAVEAGDGIGVKPQDAEILRMEDPYVLKTLYYQAQEKRPFANIVRATRSARTTKWSGSWLWTGTSTLPNASWLGEAQLARKRENSGLSKGNRSSSFDCL